MLSGDFHPKRGTLAEDSISINMGDEAEDAFAPLVFEDEPISDSILDDILNEEGFLAEIKIVELLSLEFLGAKG